MDYYNHRRNNRDSTFALLSLFFILAAMMTSCSEKSPLPYDGISMEYYQNVSLDELKVNEKHIREGINRLARADMDSAMADKYTRAYYKRGGDFLWINRYGVTRQADSLIAFLDSASLDGFNTSKLGLGKLHDNIERIRQLDFDETDDNALNESLAMVEYFLTKGLLRCGVGMKYGVTNPHYDYSKLDVKDSDSVRVTYRELFDIPVNSIGTKKFDDAIGMVRNDSIAVFLREARPKNPVYHALREVLKGTQGDYRDKVLANMERARWQTPDEPYMHEEYILVNIPAYHLWAVSKDSIIDMRIGCGSRKTKTPLLYSNIERMDINPQWVIPGTIVSKEIIHHAGDGEYFASRRYFAQHKKTGKKLYGDDITYEVLASNNYFLIQEGGEGNSLGRIIFRFPNNFAVYLHDTSSRGVFARNDRSVSHGCVRVERPYDLACFLLRGENPELAEKIKYSMENDIKAEGIKRDMLVSSAKVNPKMPVYIKYFTIMPTPTGKIESYSDVYGYDAILTKLLKGRM